MLFLLLRNRKVIHLLNELAIQLAKYFESRTEIEYDVLLKQMETVPQADIMQILGIKKKTEDSEEKELEEEKSIEEIPQLTPDDEKEADDLMASVAQKAKEEVLKADAENKQKEENEKDKDKKQKKDNIKKSPIKPCWVQMGTKVPKKSPVKVTDTDSDVVLISSDEGGKKNKKNACPLNLSLPKNDASESDRASSHGMYFTNSEEFRNAVNLSKKDEEKNKGGNETDSGSSHGVYFSDSDEFRKALNLSKKSWDNNNNDGNETETDGSFTNRVYFSDGDEFRKAVNLSKKSQGIKKDGNEAVTETDGSSSNGVYFSDSDEFKAAKLLSQTSKEDGNDVKIALNDSKSCDLKKASTKADESSMESDGTTTTSSGGVYFSDIEEYNKAKAKAQEMVSKLDESDSGPLFEKDTDSMESEIDQKIEKETCKEQISKKTREDGKEEWKKEIVKNDETEQNEKGLGNDQGKKEEENRKVFDKEIDKEMKDNKELTEDTDAVKPKSDKGIEKENKQKEDDKSTEDTDAVIENTVDKEIEEKEDENKITQETDGDHKTELNSENTRRTVTDAPEVGEVDQIQGEDKNCEEKHIEGEGKGGAVEIKTSARWRNWQWYERTDSWHWNK